MKRRNDSKRRSASLVSRTRMSSSEASKTKNRPRDSDVRGISTRNAMVFIGVLCVVLLPFCAGYSTANLVLLRIHYPTTLGTLFRSSRTTLFAMDKQSSRDSSSSRGSNDKHRNKNNTRKPRRTTNNGSRKNSSTHHRNRNNHIRRPSNGTSPTQDASQAKTASQFNQALKQLLRSSNGRRGRWKQGEPRRQRSPTPAQQGRALLLERIYQYNNSTSISRIRDYDTISFNLILQAFSQERSMAAARQAEELLDLLWSLEEGNSTVTAKSKDLPLLQVDAYSYAAVLNAYAKSGGRLRAAQRATELLEQMQQRLHPSTSRAVRTDVCHNAVMNAWAVSGDTARAGPRAEQILRSLLTEDSKILPTRISFNACIKGYAKSGQPDEARRLLEELRKLSVSAESRRGDLTPDKISYSTVIDAYSLADPNDYPDAAKQAESLLREMETDFETTKNERLRPDVVAYTSVLTAFSRSGHVVNHEVALDLLDRMKRYSSDRPNAPFMNAWIHLLAKAASSSPKDATELVGIAKEVLRFMQREYASGNADMKPCKISYTAMIAVLAQTGTVAAAQQAEAMLDELEQLWNLTNHDPDYLPNAKTFASVLNAWAKSGSPNAVGVADRILHRMEDLYNRTGSDELKPNLIVFTQMFPILSNCGDSRAATRAKELLQKMHDLYLAGYQDVRPDATTYAYLINTFTKSKVENVAELATTVLSEAEEGFRQGIGSLRPTGLLYSAVLQAYAKSASPEGAALAEELLERTKEQYKQGKLYSKPTTLFYNAVMDAHARSNGGREAALRAEELLQELESRGRAGDSSLKPKTRSFNAAILAWKNSQADDAPERAEALLKQMNDRYRAGDSDCRPDSVTLNSIIAVWANSGKEQAAERAEEFLQFMEEVYKESGDASLKPDAWTFNTAISAYAKSRRPDRMQRARQLYDRMKHLYETTGDADLRPDAITFTLLKTIWAKSKDGAATPGSIAAIGREIARFQGSTVKARK